MSTTQVPSTEPGDRDLALALARHTQSVLQDNWAVGKVLSISPAEIVVILQNPAGADPQTSPVFPNVLPSDAPNYSGARIEFVSGVLGGITPNSNGTPALTGRISTTIKSVTTTQSGTVMVLSDDLPVAPSPGDRFIIYRSAGSAISGSVTANQGAAGTAAWPVTAAQGTPGTAPWPVTNLPTAIAGPVADGSAAVAVAVNQALFTGSTAVPSDGTIVFTVDVDASGNPAELQITRNNGTTWSVVLSAMELQPGQEYSVAFQVRKGDVWNASFAAATSVLNVLADFVPDM